MESCSTYSARVASRSRLPAELPSLQFYMDGMNGDNGQTSNGRQDKLSKPKGTIGAGLRLVLASIVGKRKEPIRKIIREIRHYRSVALADYASTVSKTLDE